MVEYLIQIAIILIALIITPVDTGYCCGCGCCQTVPVDGTCDGYIPFLGWILNDSADCSGNYPKDVAYCDNQCACLTTQ